MKMIQYWLIPILCLHSSILSVSWGAISTGAQRGDPERAWASEASKTALTKFVSKLLPSKLPQLEQNNKFRQLENNEITDLQTLKKRRPSWKRNGGAGLMQEQGFVEKNGTYVIDNNLLKEHQEDLEEINRAEKNANFDLVEGLNLMAERNENLDDVVDSVLFPDSKTKDVYTLN